MRHPATADKAMQISVLEPDCSLQCSAAAPGRGDLCPVPPFSETLEQSHFWGWREEFCFLLVVCEGRFFSVCVRVIVGKTVLLGRNLGLIYFMMLKLF